MKRLIFFSLAVLLMTGCKQQDDESMFPDRPDVREYVVTTDEAENAAFYFLYMADMHGFVTVLWRIYTAIIMMAFGNGILKLGFT